jgi:hypothetical protein
MGKVCIEDMEKYDHDLFVWITPRCQLINARYGIACVQLLFQN